MWEAAAIAHRYELDNLTVIVDCNGLQQFGWRENGEGLPPDKKLADKFESFGFDMYEVDGHHLEQLQQTIAQTKQPEFCGQY